MTDTLDMFGHEYRKARKVHTCWTCSGTIAIGEKYFITSGKINGTMFAVKHCRKTCECTAEMIDQNPQVWPQVLHAETFNPERVE